MVNDVMILTAPPVCLYNLTKNYNDTILHNVIVYMAYFALANKELNDIPREHEGLLFRACTIVKHN